MLAHKQNVFDDFHAAGDWLVGHGVTDRDRLAIMGGSNGGLLVGAALTQRPEAYAAVVCSAPLLDMVRYELSGLGATWTGEYGTVAEPEQFGWLLAYSPYHHVRDGVAYPAVLFTVFDGDGRVDTMHARKLAAALQHSTVDDRPVLLRRESDVGHAGRAVSRTVDLVADELAFLLSYTAPGRRPTTPGR
jgi:prolyl oligopeptidase